MHHFGTLSLKVVYNPWSGRVIFAQGFSLLIGPVVTVIIGSCNLIVQPVVSLGYSSLDLLLLVIGALVITSLGHSLSLGTVTLCNLCFGVFLILGPCVITGFVSMVKK